MLRRIGTALGVLLAATALAILSAWWLVLHGPIQQAVTVGPWRTSVHTGSAQADLYMRANVAVTGLFALNPSEAIYFSAARDDAGRQLNTRCAYAIEGRPVPASWWSITAYADDRFLIPSSANRCSYNMGNLKLGPEGTFKVIASPTEQSGHWLPTGGGGGGFNLLFRLYNPAPDIAADPGVARLPLIKQLGACP